MNSRRGKPCFADGRTLHENVVAAERVGFSFSWPAAEYLFERIVRRARQSVIPRLLPRSSGRICTTRATYAGTARSTGHASSGIRTEIYFSDIRLEERHTVSRPTWRIILVMYYNRPGIYQCAIQRVLLLYIMQNAIWPKLVRLTRLVPLLCLRSVYICSRKYKLSCFLWIYSKMFCCRRELRYENVNIDAKNYEKIF